MSDGFLGFIFGPFVPPFVIFLLILVGVALWALVRLMDQRDADLCRAAVEHDRRRRKPPVALLDIDGLSGRHLDLLGQTNPSMLRADGGRLRPSDLTSLVEQNTAATLGLARNRTAHAAAERASHDAMVAELKSRFLKEVQS